jgi:hypothetical protein
MTKPMAAALAQSLRRIVIVRAPRNARIARVASPLAATAGDQANQFGKNAPPTRRCGR